MTRRCIIEGCSSKSGNPQHRGVTFHSFPFDSKTRELWLLNCRINPEKNITKSVLVCSRHFRRADFQPAKSNKYLLRQGSVPTIFPWGKLTPPATPPTSDETAPAVVLKNEMETVKDPEKNIETDTNNEDSDKTPSKRLSDDVLLGSDPKMPKISESLSPPPTADLQNLVPIGTIPAASGARKTDTVSGFVPGVRLEAQDFDGIWHTARVVEVDNDEREVLIRFEKSGKSKGLSGAEEWIPMNSSRLRQKAATASKSPNVFVLGEKCLARWSGARRFPATVQKVLGNDMYEILFDDGYMKVLKSAHISKLKIPAAKAQQTSLASSPAPQKVVATPTPEKQPKTKSQQSKSDWPLISMSSLNLDELNLPEIPQDGEWCCHWVNDQPIGREGFLTVGDHKKPTVVVDDWRLPPGWTKHMYQRSNVLGKWDVILVNSSGKRFRSKADLKLYIEDLGQHYNPDVYDFSIHRRRAKDIGAYVYTKDYKPPQPLKPPPPPLEPLPPLQTQNLLQNVSNSQIDSLIAGSSPPMFESGATVKGFDDESAPLEDGYVFVGSLKVQIIDNLFRCPKEGCNKNFRKENHLQIHVKHYHDDIAKFLGDCPNMQELACKRTIGHPTDEPLPKNYLPNSQYFAKLHQQDIQNRMHRKSTSTPLTSTVSTPSRSENLDYTLPPELDESLKLADSSVLDSTLGTSLLADSTLASTSSFVHATGDEFTDPLPDESKSTPHQPQPPKPHHKTGSRKSGERKSSRQRFQKKYPTASTSTVFDNSFQLADFEDTRHSFNGTPEQRVSKKAKFTHPTFVQDPTLDGNTTGSVPEQGMPIPSPKYIQENGEVIKIVRMRSEEIINCICSFGEEDGLMIQCELCLCWQHGICNGIEKESEVPEKYVCYICKNPMLGRASMKYIHDQDWLYDGKLPTGNYHSANPKLQDRFNILRTSHTLTGNLIELKRFLHSLRVKINIAENKDHPKMYLWAKKWESSPTRNIETKVEKREFDDLEKCGGMGITEIKDEADVKIETDGNSSSEDVKMEGVAFKEESPIKPKQEVIMTQPNIPQPEAAIDPVECQHRLLEHIQKQQSFVVERLQDIESDIVELESLDPCSELDSDDFNRTKQTLAILIKDLETMQNLAKINMAPPPSYVSFT